MYVYQKYKSKIKLFFFAILFLAIFGLAKGAEAADICVGPSSSGNGSGSDWSNAAQWSALTPIRGNTYYLQDGSYAGKTLSTAASDSTYIYIKKATESDHGSATGWSGAYGDGVATFSGGAVLTITTNYWDIDGVTGGGPSSWKTGHGIEFTVAAGNGVSFIDVSDTTHVNIRHIYFNQTGNTTAYGIANSSHGIFASGGSATFSNALIEYCYFENLGGLPFFFRGGTDNVIQYNYTGDVCGCSVHDANDHCETLVMHGMNNLDFRFNFISEAPSSGGIVHNNTYESSNVRIYGNVIGNGSSISCNSGPCTNWRVFNNTFYTGYGPITGDGSLTGMLVYNNISYNMSSVTYTGTHDYNSYYASSGVPCNSGISANDKGITLIWPNDCDQTTDSYNRSPFVNAGNLDFRLADDEDAGTNACTVASITCDAAISYNKDMLGNTRTAWSRGAYEYVSGGGDATPPAAPQGLSVQ